MLSPLCHPCSPKFHFRQSYLRLFCLFNFLFFSLELSDRHHEVMGAVKSQLETSHEEELNEITAKFLAETAIKVETARLETEHEWQEKLDAIKQKHEVELQEMTEKLTQVSIRFKSSLIVFKMHKQIHAVYCLVCFLSVKKKYADTNSYADDFLTRHPIFPLHEIRDKLLFSFSTRAKYS